LLSPVGVLAGLPAGVPVVAMATIGPAAARQVAAAVASRGFAYVDAPVTGGVARARAGTLAVIASGAPSAIERVAPALAPLGTTHRVGDAPGVAQLVKLINQLLVFTHLAVTGEALAMGQAAGVDLRLLYEVLTQGAGRSEIFASHARATLDGAPAGGTLPIALKDFPLVLDAARELGVPLVTGGAAFQVVQLARALGHGEAGDTALIRMLMEWAPRRG
jgi:L-threonate 2-dehydrogenase